MSLNSPSSGASLDLGIRYRNGSDDLVTGSVTFGVGKHLGLTFTNEAVILNIGVSTPTALPFTPTLDLLPGSVKGQGRPLTLVQPADATAVNIEDPEN